MKKIKESISGFKEGQKAFIETIAVIINSILLSLVYILGVGITSIIGKLFKKNFLDMKVDKKAQSYWNDFDLKKKKVDEYYRQF